MAGDQARRVNTYWEETFQVAQWGRYPPEDLVRYVAQRFPGRERVGAQALEVGCGPGANLWFLAREGFDIAGLDGAPTAISRARAWLGGEFGARVDREALVVGDIAELPWPDARFDLVLDVVAFCANPPSAIRAAIAEVYRVLKPGGRVFAKMFGVETTGFRPNEASGLTMESVPEGPCAGMGLTHFVTEDEIRALYADFECEALDVTLRTEAMRGWRIQQYVMQARKPDAR